MKNTIIFGLRDLIENRVIKNVIAGMESPISIFTEHRGTLTVFGNSPDKIDCNFDFGQIHSDVDYVNIFDIDISKDIVSLNFPISGDKRVRCAGTIRKTAKSLFKGPFEAERPFYLIENKNKEIIFGIPGFEGVDRKGDIYIYIEKNQRFPNLQIALFNVENNTDNQNFLVFSYFGKTMKSPFYFLAISVESIEKPYEGIEFFFPEKLKG